MLVHVQVLVDDSQLLLDGPEAWPVLWYRGPTEPHHFVDLVGTVAGLTQDLPSLDSLHHLRVLGPAVGHVPTGEDLPAQDTVRPHVALAGEPGEVENLR